ncbi:MAG: hypothetical protein R3F46_06550 [bacterium]
MIKRLILTAITGILLLCAAASCGGGGGGTPVSITSINTGGGQISAGSVVPLSATLSGGNGQVLLKSWSVSAGSLMINPPDFSLVLRETAKSTSETSVATTGPTVYWVVPESAGSATVTLKVEDATRSLDVTFGASPVTLAVNSAANGQRVVTVSANGISDLFGAAFRVNYGEAYSPVSVEAGDFLGPAGETLFLGLANQADFVPVAITRRQGGGGKDGSGVLATITFAPASGSSSAKGASQSESFALDSLFFISSDYARINLGN